jgi:hypothetical protein
MVGYLVIVHLAFAYYPQVPPAMGIPNDYPVVSQLETVTLSFSAIVVWFLQASYGLILEVFNAVVCDRTLCVHKVP